jgi:hypothetical protein
MLVVDFEEDLGFNWGLPWENMRVQNIAVHADLVQIDEQGEIIAEEGAWAFGPAEFEGDQWGWWFSYEMAHPRRGHFIDSPVGGVSFSTPTGSGVTDGSGGFDYFPGERVELYVGSVYLGTPLAGHKISPLDIYENADTDDPRVINMARLLQSLDADASPQDGINITESVQACLDQAVQALGLTGVDFAQPVCRRRHPGRGLGGGRQGEPGPLAGHRHVPQGHLPNARADQFQVETQYHGCLVPGPQSQQ